MEILSKAEMNAIAAQISKAIRSLIQGCESLDMQMAFEVFLDSPEFLMVGTDGTLSSYDQYIKNNIDYLQECVSFELTTFSKQVRVLSRQTAVCAWAYGVKATLKTGEQDIIDRAGASFVFRKIGAEWKVVYYHEASVPPRRIAANLAKE